jgi:hypothetical protein
VANLRARIQELEDKLEKSVGPHDIDRVSDRALRPARLSC